MKRIIALAVMSLLLSFSFSVPSAFSITYVYDDFDSDTIDQSLWRIDDLGNVFSQEEGLLKLSTPPSQSWAHLISRTYFSGDFEAIAEWSNYSASGNFDWFGEPNTDGMHNPGLLEFQINTPSEINENYLAIYRALWPDEGIGNSYFASGIVNGGGQWGSAPTDQTSGKFKFSRVGADLSAYYWDNGWQLLVTAENFGTHDILLTVGGYTGYATDTSLYGEFDKVIVTYNPVPEPTTMLLLGSGLLGLACVRRRIKS